MPSIIIKDTEHFDIGLRKFKRACEKAAIIPDIRKKEFYEKPTEMKKGRWRLLRKEQERPIELITLLGKDPTDKACRP